ncbi:MAG: glycolate oxidase subunit GlcF [Deltaproteobacteria bacterium]|nr:glycolate oxidase subunit GlcF [Deltaproteobacteria bacterium]
MQTAISQAALQIPDTRISEKILRNCVHCGFCNATCPTYVHLGSELEGPRGRIYLMKSVLEERLPLSREVVSHLDHCLSCFSCETTCPSGVRYSHLVDPMRAKIEREFRRPWKLQLLRWVLTQLLPYPGRFRWALRMARWQRPFRFLLWGTPRAMLSLAPAHLPAPSPLEGSVHVAQGVRRARVALLTGCAQRVLAPHVNEATVRYLTRIGCEVVAPPQVQCCGALVYHMGDHPRSLPHMKHTLAAWWAEMEQGGLDYIVINASGCGTVVKDYGHIFRDDPEYRDKAARVSAITVDVTELAHRLGLPINVKARVPDPVRVAYHDACSLQHGQKIRSQPRELLRQAGYTVVDIPQGHLCCGSAGTYNMLQPVLAETLGRDKARHIAGVQPQVVAMGNIGCMEQIERFSTTPVVHTVELLDWATGGPEPKALHRDA